MAKKFRVQDLVNNDNTVSVISHQLRVNNEMAGEGEVKVFNLEKVHENEYNPRKLIFTREQIKDLASVKPYFDEYLEQTQGELKDQLLELIGLASSIESSGLLQPIVVTDHPTIANEYMVVAGERRYWSHILLGRTVIRGIYRSVDEKNHRVLSIAENLARHDLSLKEKVIGLKDLISMDESFNKAEQVMKLFGIRKSAAYLLLKAVKEELYFNAIVEGKITQFRDMDGFGKNEATIESDNKIPTVGKTAKADDLCLKLNKDQIIKLASLLSITDKNEHNLAALIIEKIG